MLVRGGAIIPSEFKKILNDPLPSSARGLIVKYAPLYSWLVRKNVNVSDVKAPITFSKMEKILGCSLPPSANTSIVWWDNEKCRIGTRHAQAKAWMLAGWEVTRVNQNSKHVTFERVDFSLELLRFQQLLKSRYGLG